MGRQGGKKTLKKYGKKHFAKLGSLKRAEKLPVDNCVNEPLDSKGVVSV